MARLLSGFRFAVLVVALTVIAGFCLTALYYKGKSERFKDRIEFLSTKNKELTYRIENLSRECDATVRALQESCSDRLKIEREQAKKQLRACRKLLERRQRLEDKLRDIDRL